MEGRYLLKNGCKKFLRSKFRGKDFTLIVLAFNKLKMQCKLTILNSTQEIEREEHFKKNIRLPRDLYNWHGWKIGGSSSHVAQYKE